MRAWRVWTALVVLLAAAPLYAHPLAPGLLELRETSHGRYDVLWKTPRLRAPGASLEAVLPAHCHDLSAPAQEWDDNSVRSRWRVDCGHTGLVGASLTVGGMTLASDAAVVRVTLLGGRSVQGVISARQPRFTVPARPSISDVIYEYFRLGGHHILSGIDHLLFVFGLFLLAATLRSLVATITAFTLGHCVTLSLAALDLITPPSRWIELAIALSVFLLAVELAYPRATLGPPTLLRRFPWLMALLFGLLHGLGFAGGLREAGLPSGEVPVALAAFNLGIEAGQLAFVTLLLGLQQSRRWIPLQPAPWLRTLPLYAMGSLAAFWTFERLALLLR